MGWTFAQSWTSKKVLVDYLTKDVVGGPDDRNLSEVTLTKKIVGKTLYFVREFTRREDGVRERVIFVVLLESDVKRGIGWGYKDMDEGMGPVEDDCPVEFFVLVPEPPNDYAREWRKRVIAKAERAEKIRKNLRVGANLTFIKGCKPSKGTIIAMNPNYILVETPDHVGMIYKISKRNYKLIEEIS